MPALLMRPSLSTSYPLRRRVVEMFSFLLLLIRRNFGRKSQYNLIEIVCARTKKRSNTAEMRSAFGKSHKLTYRYLTLFIKISMIILKEKNNFFARKNIERRQLYFSSPKNRHLGRLDSSNFEIYCACVAQRTFFCAWAVPSGRAELSSLPAFEAYAIFL